MKKQFAFTILFLFVAAVAAAQPRPHPQKLLADYLQLSDQQVTEFQQIQSETAAVVQPLQASAHSLQQQLHDALQAATPDATAVGKLALQLESVRAQIKAAHDAADARRLAILNTDQKVKYQAFQAAMAFIRQERPHLP